MTIPIELLSTEKRFSLLIKKLSKSGINFSFSESNTPEHGKLGYFIANNRNMMEKISTDFEGFLWRPRRETHQMKLAFFNTVKANCIKFGFTFPPNEEMNYEEFIKIKDICKTYYYFVTINPFSIIMKKLIVSVILYNEP